MIEKGSKNKASKRDIIDLGVTRLPKFNKDSTDRNRTSPLPLPGISLNFAAVGSSQNISTPIAVINTIIAESLDYVAERIKKPPREGFSPAVLKVIAELVKETKDIRFEEIIIPRIG